MKNKIIVESKNDMHFVKCLLEKVQKGRDHNVQVGVEEIFPDAIVDFAELEGSDKTKLKTKLKDVIADVRREKIQKVGILLDRDEVPESERIQLINEAVQTACTEMGAVCSGTIAEPNTFYEVTYQEQRFSVVCGLVGLEGKGELTHLLRATANQPSDFADCLQAWRDCAQTQEKTIKDKEYVKLWVDFYIRWDTCSKKDRKQADKKCSMSTFETVLDKDIFDFEHPALSDLRTFLAPFAN
jgi:hypothetical protein